MVGCAGVCGAAGCAERQDLHGNRLALPGSAACHASELLCVWRQVGKFGALPSKGKR